MSGAKFDPLLGQLRTRDVQNLVTNVKDYGATGNGTTDDTTAIQNAINAGGITFFPTGTYLVGGLTLIGGSHLVGVGAGHWSHSSASSQRSILKLKNSSNNDVLTIPVTIAHGIIEDLEIDGNGTNQTSGTAISFTSNSVMDEADWILRNVEVYNTYSHGIYVGTWRTALYGERVLITGVGGNGLYLDSNADDSTWLKLMVGSAGINGIAVYGWVTRIIGSDIWSSTQNGIYIDSNMVTVAGTGVDHSQQNGITIDTSADNVTVTGCSFHSNSQQANNTYDDIYLNASTGNFSFGANQFGPLDTGITNKRKYAIGVGSNTATAVGNTQTASATGTAFSDNPSLIGITTGRLTLNPTAYIDGSTAGVLAFTGDTKVEILSTYGNNPPGNTPLFVEGAVNQSATTFVVTQQSGQTGDLLEFQDSGSGVIDNITSDGRMSLRYIGSQSYSLAVGTAYDGYGGILVKENSNSQSNPNLLVQNSGGSTVFQVAVGGNTTVGGSLTLSKAGSKLNITTGSNASAGTGTLSGGTVTISTTAVTANSLIFLTDTASSLTNVGTLSVSSKTAGTSFMVTSSNALDSSTFSWLIIN